MDAVKRQIDALHGSLSMASEEGKGTPSLDHLALDAGHHRRIAGQVGNDQFIIPMAAVTENVELLGAQRAAQQRTQRHCACVANWFPTSTCARCLTSGGEPPPIEKIVIVRHEDQRVGIVVDRVLGTHQTVIQSLGRFFRNIKVVSGATIMGDGRVALILDIAAVVRFADGQCQASLAAPRPPLANWWFANPGVCGVC